MHTQGSDLSTSCRESSAFALCTCSQTRSKQRSVPSNAARACARLWVNAHGSLTHTAQTQSSLTSRMARSASPNSGCSTAAWHTAPVTATSSSACFVHSASAWRTAADDSSARRARRREHDTKSGASAAKRAGTNLASAPSFRSAPASPMPRTVAAATPRSEQPRAALEARPRRRWKC